jgi:diguanylate cyclase (GGDEF)-like protein
LSAEPSEGVAVLGASGASQTLLVAHDPLSLEGMGAMGAEGVVSMTHSALLRRRLFEWGQLVATASPDGWKQALDSDDPPEVVLVDATSETERADTRLLCRDLRLECDEVGAVLVVALPASAASEARDWDAWHEAGAHALLDPASPSGAARSWFELWANHARLQREHGVLRETLGKQVQHDELTQLLNRRFFFQLAHREVSRARRYEHPLSCLMLDVNYFQLFNKTFGFACGDHILRQIAQIVRSWTRESDIVARFGAKKFAILLPQTDVGGAMLLREKLQREIGEAAFEWGERRLPVTVSIGEAERRTAQSDLGVRDYAALEWNGEDAPPSVREELADLLEDADAALFVAKKGIRYPSLALPTDTEIIGILGRE